MEESNNLKQVKISDEEKEQNGITQMNTKNIMIILFIVSVIITAIIYYFCRGTKDAKSSVPTHYDYLIIGSGLYGATFNYLAKKAGKTTLVLEKRSTMGGNLYCEKIEGIFVHKYGPHIFHTDNKKVWDFVNSLVEFVPYQNQPISRSKDKLYNLPFNMWTFNQIWGVTTPEEAQKKIEEQRFKGEVHNLEDQAKSLVGSDIYEKFIKGYTQKQWGRECPNLPPFIIKRLPTRFIYDNNYFYDRYQGIPQGCYNEFIKALFNDTEVLTDVDYFKFKDRYTNVADTIVYTGKIDEYFGYKFGKLEYRTVRWENKVEKVANFQGNAVINYPDPDVPYTRVIEHKHFEPYNKEIQEKKKTVISYEYSEEWDETKESYYPINDEKNNNMYMKYKELADQEKNVIFGGRLAQYKYFDMKDIIEDVFKKFNM